MSEPRKYFDTPSAGNYTSIGKSTLDKMRMTGEGPAFLKVGHRVVYERAALDEWLASKRCRSTADQAA